MNKFTTDVIKQKCILKTQIHKVVIFVHCRLSNWVSIDKKQYTYLKYNKLHTIKQYNKEYNKYITNKRYKQSIIKVTEINT